MSHSSHHFDLFVVPGGAALSPFRTDALLARLQEAAPKIAGVSAQHIHLVASDEALSDHAAEAVARILDTGVSLPQPPATAAAASGTTIVVAPRLGTISPWASKATDIVRNCGIDVHRVERVTEYTLTTTDELSHDQ